MVHYRMHILLRVSVLGTRRAASKVRLELETQSVGDHNRKEFVNMNVLVSK